MTNDVDGGRSYDASLCQVAVAALLLVAISILAFQPGLAGEFVWDDDLLLIDHANYRSPELILSSLRSLFIISPSYFRPLGYMSFFLDYSLFGAEPIWYHLENLTLHISTTLLVLLLLLKLNITLWRATAITAFFAIHPSRVESVIFISSRFDLLAALYFTAGLLVHRSSFHRQSWGYRWTAVFLFVMALLAKEMAVTLPAVAWLCDRFVWPKSLASRRSRQHKKDVQWMSPKAYLPYLAGLAVYLSARILVLGSALVTRESAIEIGGVLGRILLVGRTMTGYLWLTIFPYLLGPVHYLDRVSVFDLQAWFGLAVLGFGLWVIWTGKIWRGARGGIAISLILILPVLNLIPIRLAGPSFMAERFLYLPLLGVVLGIRELKIEKRRITWVLVVCVLSSWLLVCRQNSARWISDRELFSWVAGQTPQSALGFTNLGLEETRDGNPGLAAALSESALVREPSNPDAWDNLGVAYFQLGRLAMAESCFVEALHLAPRHPLFATNLAGTWRSMGRYDEALELLGDVLRTDRTAASAYLNIGLCYMEMGRAVSAVEPFQRAANLMDVDSEAWLSLAKALTLTGNTSEARVAVQRAIRLGLDPSVVGTAFASEGRKALSKRRVEDSARLMEAALTYLPNDAGIWNDLGVCYRSIGQFERAESCFVGAGRLAQNMGLAWANLGEILVLRGDEARAESILAEVILRWPALPDAYRHLGLLLHREGREDSAKTILSKYLEIAPDGIFAPEVRSVLRPGG